MAWSWLCSAHPCCVMCVSAAVSVSSIVPCKARQLYVSMTHDFSIYRQSLSGEWELRHDDQLEWRSIPVPGCWEAIGITKDDPGPFWYRKQLPMPPNYEGKRIWLRFGGVSYDCQAWVNGEEIAEHRG